jgi:hypothetical protein
MMRFLVVLACLTVAGSAAADDGQVVLEQMKECVALPATTAPFEAQIAMSFDAGRLLRIKVLSVTPANDVVAGALVRGVERCQPFGAITGALEVTVTDVDILGEQL